MSMVEQIGAGLSGLEQLRALIANGQRPGIGVALDFDLVEIDEGHAVFSGTPGSHAYNSDRLGAWRLRGHAARLSLRLRCAFAPECETNLYDARIESRLPQSNDA